MLSLCEIINEVCRMVLFDYVFNLGCDFFKDKIINEDGRRAIRKEIEAYFSRKRIENYDCSLDDEIDFTGLIDYISHELHSKLEQRLFGRTSKERGQAHREIIEQAIGYSHAQTGGAQKKVIKIINDTLCILYGIHWSRVPQSTQLATATIVDEIEEQHSEQTQALLSAIEEVKASQSLFSPKENLDLIKQGNIEQVDENLTGLYKVLSTRHKLSPYYGFAPQSDGFNLHSISVPLSEDAIMKYPPNIKAGSASMGSMYQSLHKAFSIIRTDIKYLLFFISIKHKSTLELNWIHNKLRHKKQLELQLL